MPTTWTDARTDIDGSLTFSESFDGGDDLIPHHIALQFIPPSIEVDENGDVVNVIYHHPRLCFDINDIRIICLNCGNSPDCCTC
jgi:hypothetical protein